jgi:RNA polymerase sigma-70 factor, ECF subfamily
MASPAPRPDDGGEARVAAHDEVVRLATRARDGDREAFQLLYRLHADRVFRFAASIVRDRGDAEDAAAETFLQAWRDLPRLRDCARYEAWLLQIAHRRSLDQLRKYRPTHPLDEAFEVAETRRDRSPVDATLDAEDVTGLRTAMNELPEAQRTVLVLRYLFEMSHDEIASATGRSSAAVRQLRQRGLASLRRALERGASARGFDGKGSP